MSISGYKFLKSYQLSVVIFDLTMEFTKRWIPSYSRTRDQMEQAARSGKQNIAEGYLEKSLKSYIKLLGVARASLGELLEDYDDFARQNKIPVWSLEKIREMREVRDIWEKNSPNYPYIPSLPNSQEEAVNLLLTVVNQASYLLDKQIAVLEEKFIREGGFTENLFKRRQAQRYKD